MAHCLIGCYGLYDAVDGRLSYSSAVLGHTRSDPSHFDGGPSLFHGAVSLWGPPRCITFEQTDGGEPVALTTKPGHIYVGSICGPRHWVVHEGGPPEDFYSSSTLGLIEVALLLRSASFQQTRGTVRPNPVAVFEAVLEGILPCFETASWCLPSLAECKEALLTLELG